MDEEPVEILVSMAERGEIDPWNIDIVEVTDRFLSELEQLKVQTLKISGRTLFYAATLLRMKSEYLEELEDEAGDDLIEEIDEFTDDFGLDDAFAADDFSEPIARLEREIQRRIRRKEKRKRPVTLYELIKQLKTAEKAERRRQRRRMVSQTLPILDADDVVGLAHEENFADFSSAVMETFERVAPASGDVTLGTICSEMERDRCDVYIPLLFLMVDGKLLITQDEFFGEIRVSRWRAEASD
jgi:segregation and condensation protein A